MRVISVYMSQYLSSVESFQQYITMQYAQNTAQCYLMSENFGFLRLNVRAQIFFSTSEHSTFLVVTQNNFRIRPSDIECKNDFNSLSH